MKKLLFPSILCFFFFASIVSAQAGESSEDCLLSSEPTPQLPWVDWNNETGKWRLHSSRGYLLAPANSIYPAIKQVPAPAAPDENEPPPYPCEPCTSPFLRSTTTGHPSDPPSAWGYPQ